MPLSIKQIQEIVNDLSYKDWKFHLGENGSVIWLQIRFQAPDNTRPGVTEWQHGRKWMLSPHMTKSEIVQTALKAVLTAEEHEAREQFRYRGVTVLAPHFDVDTLAELARAEEFDIRGITGRSMGQYLQDTLAEIQNGKVEYQHAGTDLGNKSDKTVRLKKTRVTNNTPKKEPHHHG